MMLRRRGLLVALAVIVALPLAWLVLRSAWEKESPAGPEGAAPRAGTGQETPAQAGLRLLQGGKPGEALPLLRQASRLAPDDAIVLNNLCVAEIQVGELGAALRNCGRAVELAPDFQLARNNLEWARTEGQRLKLSLLSREVEVGAARKASGWITLGMGWYRLKEWDQSLRCFERALQLEPRNVVALNDVGAVWMEKQRPEVALGLFDRALAIDPGNQLARSNRAWAQAELQKASPRGAAAP